MFEAKCLQSYPPIFDIQTYILLIFELYFKTVSQTKRTSHTY
jgi:hypothetical protein